MVQWLGLGTFAAMGLDSIPGRETKIPQATQRGKKKKKFGGPLFLPVVSRIVSF